MLVVCMMCLLFPVLFGVWHMGDAQQMLFHFSSKFIYDTVLFRFPCLHTCLSFYSAQSHGAGNCVTLSLGSSAQYIEWHIMYNVCLWKAIRKKRQERKRKKNGRKGRNWELGKHEYTGRKFPQFTRYCVLVTYTNIFNPNSVEWRVLKILFVLCQWTSITD